MRIKAGQNNSWLIQKRQPVAMRGLKVNFSTSNWQHDRHRDSLRGLALQAGDILVRANYFIPYLGTPARPTFEVVDFQDGLLLLGQISMAAIFRKPIAAPSTADQGLPSVIPTAFQMINDRCLNLASEEFFRREPALRPEGRRILCRPNFQITVIPDQKGGFLFHSYLAGFYFSFSDYAIADRGKLMEGINLEIDRFRNDRLPEEAFEAISNNIRQWFRYHVHSAIEFVEGGLVEGRQRGQYMHAVVPNASEWTESRLDNLLNQLSQDAGVILSAGRQKLVKELGVPPYWLELVESSHRMGRKNQQLVIGLLYVTGDFHDTRNALFQKWRQLFLAL